MKKIFLVFNLISCFLCYSQSIQINTSTYSVPELVKDVLINKNCITLNNITWRTGNTNGYGSTNGIGYFENTNPNFPLKKGVVLSTGNVLNAAGPNTSMLDDGNDTWLGDADLEATLSSAGIPMQSLNATVLEFDFIPFSSNFDFQFLFASEEYGNYQCQFSDAFAFLLTNESTGVTTNLAVIAGTTTPISVVTIRDFLYNSSCPSANSNYFGSFNGGSAAESSATNFNGQTVVMNASSTTLIPNTTYHIKLVIADRKDFKADSAIFLGANSFNVGQDVLGPDLTIASKTALCENTSYTINSSLDPTIYSFEWTYNDTPIGGNTPSIIANKPGKYGLTYSIKSTSCSVTTDFIKIEYYDPIITPEPIDLYKCDSGQSNFTFDLAINTPIVNVPGNQISYHASKNDALSNANPLPATYTISSGNFPTTIWIRIENTSKGCVITKSFELKTTPPPVANFPGNISLCENTQGSKTASFAISSQTTAILNGQSSDIYSVSYYSNLAEADSRTNPIATSNITSGNATIFARIQNNTGPKCYSITSFKLNVIPRPLLDVIPNQYVCKSFILPVLENTGTYYSGANKGLPILYAGDEISIDKKIYIYNETANTPVCSEENNFTIKIIKPVDITPNSITVCDQYLLPANLFNMRYFTMPGGPNGGGDELFGGKTILTTIGLTTLYTYFESTELNSCTLESKFDITIDETPKITGTFTNIFECISYDLPPLSVGNYYTYNKSNDKYTLAVSPIISTTTLYVFAQNNSCRTPDIIFTVYIGSLGLSNINQCNSYNLPSAPIGEYRDAPNGGGNLIQPGIISKSTTIYTYVSGAGTPNCTANQSFKIKINAPFLTKPADVTACESYLLPSQIDQEEYYTLPGGSTNAENVKLIPNKSIITETSTLYIFKKSLEVADCYNEIPWSITINKKPKIDSRGSIVQCDDYQLTPLENGNYFNEPNGVNPIPTGTIISEKNKRIYIYAVNQNDKSCYAENFFDITINGAKADPIPSQLTYCDSFTFPPLPSPNNFYYDAPGGPSGGGNKIPFGTTITKATAMPFYYTYYETGDRLNCFNENAFKITIVNKPVANPVNSIEVCDTFGPNDGIYQFDLTTSDIRRQILSSQNPDSEFTLTFYNSQAEANNPNAIPIANPQKYQNLNPNNDSVWIRVANNSIANPCFDTVELKLKVNRIPNINLKTEYFVCEDYATGLLLNSATLNTGLSTTNYSFAWTFNGESYGGNTASITSSKSGTYAVIATNTTTLCTSTYETKITIYNPHIEITYSDAFEEPSSITVTVLGNGSENYEYQIDGSNYQDSNIFNAFIPGEHTIAVNDKNGNCNPAPIKVIIINYPKFFTPNGDGYNETWNIKHLLSTNPNAQIAIFDRFGKQITQITPSTQGWNGLLNGQLLPSSDYWFTVDYSEKGIQKTFKSHFTLKR
ncbi:T9SS type B sorting domain-containing protein [Flavobacterium cellulosilyticum]|uniref:T9SS type B sorting domain-containing protein n=1 Tax=Flavobacterium cellulosilyticum TaxID=2541731 RepID=A0A4R5CI17_9FLAO|nr:choice-of-anchor L domain-containing protein [Flavobacterium cellulosilyticum]TDD96972.1 T9SS type B sorting domain-containing protein [Flavobacterium cellulosilyticum]